MMKKNRVFGCMYNGKLMLKFYTENGIYLTEFKEYLKRNVPVVENGGFKKYA